MNVTVAQAGDFLTWGPLYVALDQGFFAAKSLQVNVTKVSGGPLALAALVGGSADFSTSTMGELFPAAIKGQQVKVIAPLTAVSQNNCVIGNKHASAVPDQSKPWNDRISALKGLKVGVTSVGGGVSKTLGFMLKTAGLDPDTGVTQTAIGSDPTAWVAAMQNGVIDAMCAGIPIPETVISQGAGKAYVTPSLGEVPGLTGLVDGTIATTQTVIGKKPAEVKAFVSAMNQAMAFIVSNPAAASASMKKLGFPSLPQAAFDLGFKDISKGFSKSSAFPDAAFEKTKTFVSFQLGVDVTLTKANIYADIAQS